MLLSERCCVNPRHLELHAGTPRPILLGPAWTKCSFQLKQDDLLTPLELNQAQCLFEVVPTLTEDGKVRLHFTPQIRHGETTLVAEPVQHPSGERDWNLQKRQPVESYSWLGWDLTLSPSEYALVGTRFERGGTLGHRCFVNTDEDRPVQRLLVIRCGRSLPSPAVLVEASPKGTPSLALQASWSSARGTAP
jgi:hypothetical protein